MTRRVVKLLAVADAVDLVHDRRGRIAGAQEVRVQRVHVALGFALADGFFDSAAGGDERLAGDLSAENALALLVWRLPAEDVDLDAFEIEELDEIVESRLVHRHTVGPHDGLS